MPKKSLVVTDPVADRYARILKIPAAKKIEDYQASITVPGTTHVDYGDRLLFALVATIMTGPFWARAVIALFGL